MAFGSLLAEVVESIGPPMLQGRLSIRLRRAQARVKTEWPFGWLVAIQEAAALVLVPEGLCKRCMALLRYSKFLKCRTQQGTRRPLKGRDDFLVVIEAGGIFQRKEGFST